MPAKSSAGYHRSATYDDALAVARVLLAEGRPNGERWISLMAGQLDTEALLLQFGSAEPQVEIVRARAGQSDEKPFVRD